MQTKTTCCPVAGTQAAYSCSCWNFTMHFRGEYKRIRSVFSYICFWKLPLKWNLHDSIFAKLVTGLRESHVIALVDSKRLKAQDSSLGSQNWAKSVTRTNYGRPKTQLRSDRDRGMHLYPAAGSPILHELPMDHFALAFSHSTWHSNTKTKKRTPSPKVLSQVTDRSKMSWHLTSRTKWSQKGK